MAIPTIHDVQAREQPAPDTWVALAQRDGETKKAYQAFIDYALMGPGRSLRKLCERYRGQTDGEAGAEKPPSRRLATLETWSSDYKWQERLDAWTAERQLADQAQWEARQRAIREADWEAGEALRGLAGDILAQSPQFLKTTRRLVKGSKGQPDREVITIGIDLDAMLRVLKLASDLQRNAADIPQQVVLRSQDEQGRLVPMTLTLVQPPPPDGGDGSR